MTALNTFLFDLDGTLINSNKVIIQSYEHAYKTHLPDRNISRKTIIDQIGPTLEETFSTHTKDPFLIKKLIETYQDYYKAHEKELFELYEGVRSTLKKLEDKGMNLAIVTNKYRDNAWPSIKYFGFHRLFDRIVTLDEVKRPKPNPESVHLALKAFDSVEKAIMVGDNDSDIEAGNRAGILSAGVSWSIKGRAFLKSVQPDYMLENMQDIFNIMKKE